MAKILCVEDEANIRELLADELAAEGYEVAAAANGKEALEKLAAYVPDIILSDIAMPKMDGFELLENVRTNLPHLAECPFLFLTAFSSREEELEARAKGVDNYIRKPVDFDVLFSILSSHLEQVTRMRAHNEQNFVKLYRAMSEPSPPNEIAPVNSVASPPAAAPAETPPANHEKTATSIASAAPSEEQSTPEVNAELISTECPTDGKTVYGTVFRFPNLRKMAEDAGADYPSTWKRLRVRASEILTSLLYDEDVVSTTAEGEFFVAHRTASKEQAEAESIRLSKALQEKLVESEKGQQEEHSLPPDLIENALVVSNALFEIDLPGRDTVSPARFEKAVIEVVNRTRDDDRAPMLLVTSMHSDNATMVPLTLASSSNDELPIRFFDFDSRSKRKMRASYAFFNQQNRAKAGYLIDKLSLDLLSDGMRQIGTKDVVVVDVNYDTLASTTYAPMYQRRFQEFARACRHPIMINIRAIPLGVKDEQIERAFKGLGDAGERRCVQTKIAAVGEYANLNLPVNCIVVSHPELIEAGAPLDLFASLKPQLAKSKTLLILRGLPDKGEIARLNKFGFNGYAIEAEPVG